VNRHDCIVCRNKNPYEFVGHVCDSLVAETFLAMTKSIVLPHVAAGMLFKLGSASPRFSLHILAIFGQEFPA
jgi:hypothetical protein